MGAPARILTGSRAGATDIESPYGAVPPMSENNKESRLPPPAFPPGVRKHVHRSSRGTGAKRSESAADAFISPDDPMPQRKLHVLDGSSHLTPIDADEEGQVVGMDLSPHLEEAEAVSGGDPHVIEVMDAVAKLTAALRRRGEAGLRSTPGMSRFEATLRAYCVGYLAGRRAEEPPPPEVEEALPTDG